MEFEITAPVYSHRSQNVRAAEKEKKPSLYHTFFFPVKICCLYNPQCSWTAGGSLRDCVTFTSSLTTTWERGCRGLVNSLLSDSTRSSGSTECRHTWHQRWQSGNITYFLFVPFALKMLWGNLFCDVNLIKCQCDFTRHLRIWWSIYLISEKVKGQHHCDIITHQNWGAEGKAVTWSDIRSDTKLVMLILGASRPW